MDEQTRGLEKLAALAESICDKRDEAMIARSRTAVDAAKSGKTANDKEQLELTMTYRQNIGTNVKRLRKRDHLRQSDLADMINSVQGQIAALEKAKISVGLHTLTRLASAFKVDPAVLLLPPGPDNELPPALAAHEPTQELLVARATSTPDAAQPPQGKPMPASELLLGSFGTGISLTTMKEMAAATHKRLEALERRHGSVPVTREMMTSVLLAVLHVSQNIDEDDENRR